MQGDFFGSYYQDQIRACYLYCSNKLAATMFLIQRMNKITKAVLLAAMLLLFYGYMCRLVNIYFFWESKSFCWFLLIAGIIMFFFSNIKYKRPKDKHSVLEK